MVAETKQEVFTDLEYGFRKKKTLREEFQEIVNKIIPGGEWVRVIELYYSSGNCGRPTVSTGKMLRMYLLQICFSLSAPAKEDSIYGSYAVRKVTGIDLMTESVSNEVRPPELAIEKKQIRYFGGKRLYADSKK